MDPNHRATLASRGNRSLREGTIPTMVGIEGLVWAEVREGPCRENSERQTHPIGAVTFARPAV